jgi:copper resistance protein B
VSRRARRAAAACALAWTVLAWPALAQTPGADPNSRAPFGPPVDDRQVVAHLIADQLEGRLGPGGADLRWDAQAWAGPDEYRIRLRTEGERTSGGRVQDGQTELMASKPVSTFWDVQAGGRYDLDSGPGRGWGAIGVQGLAPGRFDVEATAYFGQMGAAARLRASVDLLLTNRLILQPEAELEAYGRDDPARRIGAGVSDLDAGLRLRYEISRKFAPYLGVTWAKRFGRTAELVRASGASADEVRLAAGVRAWF